MGHGSMCVMDMLAACHGNKPRVVPTLPLRFAVCVTRDQHVPTEELLGADPRSTRHLGPNGARLLACFGTEDSFTDLLG